MDDFSHLAGDSFAGAGRGFASARLQLGRRTVTIAALAASPREARRAALFLVNSAGVGQNAASSIRDLFIMLQMKQFGRRAFLGMSAALTFGGSTVLNVFSSAARAADAQTTVDAKTVAALRQKGIEYLKVSQSADGSWTTPTVPGITGLCTTGLLRAGAPASDPNVAKGLKFLEGLIQADGGIYLPTSNHKNYETAIALMAFAAANKDGKYDALVKKAGDYLRGIQWDETEGQKPADFNYGGAGYGKSQRPDLSNTVFFLDALKAAGAKSDDPAFQKALKFVSRCQNLESEHNTTPFAAKVNDGGFYYTPAAGGNSQAGNDENGGLRSYASMTYAGLKSYIYAGLTKDDPRVKAATAWLRKHYSLAENPGMGLQGLYYYYHTVAKTLSSMDSDTFEDDKGTKHDWRKELVDVLAKAQKPNGSWINATDRWYEGDPNIVTAYVLMTLEHCDAKATK